MMEKNSDYAVIDRRPPACKSSALSTAPRAAIKGRHTLKVEKICIWSDSFGNGSPLLGDLQVPSKNYLEIFP